jgi:hypothetical protein
MMSLLRTCTSKSRTPYSYPPKWKNVGLGISLFCVLHTQDQTATDTPDGFLLFIPETPRIGILRTLHFEDKNTVFLSTYAEDHGLCPWGATKDLSPNPFLKYHSGMANEWVGNGLSFVARSHFMPKWIHSTRVLRV